MHGQVIGLKLVGKDYQNIVGKCAGCFDYSGQIGECPASSGSRVRHHGSCHWNEPNALQKAADRMNVVLRDVRFEIVGVQRNGLAVVQEMKCAVQSFINICHGRQ